MTVVGPDRQPAPAPLRRTLSLARPVAGRVARASLLGAGAVLADVGLIATAAWLIARAAQHPNESRLGLAIVGVQFFGLSRGFLRYGERLAGHDAALRLLADLRVRLYRRLERLTPAGLPGFRHGDLLARTVDDVDTVQDLAVRVVPPAAVAVLAGTATVVLQWALLPAAGLVLGVALLVAATAVPWLVGTVARRREARFAAVRGELAAAVVDLCDGAAELVAFGAAGDQVAEVARLEQRRTAIAGAAATTAGIGGAATVLLAGLACAGSLATGVAAVADGRLGAPELAVVTLVPLASFEIVVGLPGAGQALHRVRQAAARLFEVVDTPDPVAEADSPDPLPAPPHRLELREVWARQPGAPAPALRGVDLALRPGRRVAVVGPSGAGKSTLADLLLRFVPVEAGRAALDGVPLDRLDGDALRTVVGRVDQGAYLFDTSIAANLRIGRRTATDAELVEAVERVGLGPWLAGLPRGLATGVGRHGTELSGGQRQRLGVARALLAEVAVLVADEPAEHLEVEAADALVADLLAATAGRTLLLITHRLAGLAEVDEVVVLDRGRVVERGDHASLLAAGGRYAELWAAERAADLAAGARSCVQPVPGGRHHSVVAVGAGPDDGSS